ncbi:MAG: WXG100 family type VII secretion target [Jatrophihabitans sp.]|uniref:WXG100 family type VII secretion target n=1 Tax=Jatrophihabitans sp. TaxID=1932789 RepID=UPI003F7E670F
MSAYTVSFPAVAGASGSLTGAAEQLRADLLALQRSVDGLLGTGWRGRAATVFRHDWERWHGAAVDVVDTLAALASMVARGGGAYESTEAEVRRAAAS